MRNALASSASWIGKRSSKRCEINFKIVFRHTRGEARAAFSLPMACTSVDG
jgi:hypothetical protein